MIAVRRLLRAADVVREAWRLSRVPPNDMLFTSLVGAAHLLAPGRPGVRVYLERFRALGAPTTIGEWTIDDSSSEVRLAYESTVFAPGLLRVLPGARRQEVIVFLHGHQSSASDVFDDPNHGQYMRGVAHRLGMSLACWDWPLQGQRRDRGLYLGLGSVLSSEREYARILPALGTSLWRECVAELALALDAIHRWAGPGARLHVVGWSMGGCFAYVAPLLGTPVATTIAGGSCARIIDLLMEGKTRVHGYFFYPMLGLAYFDLDDVVHEALARGATLHVVHGELDPGCLDRTRQALSQRAAALGRKLPLDIVPGISHEFAPFIRSRIADILASD